MLPPLRLCLDSKLVKEFPFQIPFEFSPQCFQRIAGLIEHLTADRRIDIDGGYVNTIDDKDNKKTREKVNKTTQNNKNDQTKNDQNDQHSASKSSLNHHIDPETLPTSLDLADLSLINDILIHGFVVERRDDDGDQKGQNNNQNNQNNENNAHSGAHNHNISLQDDYAVILERIIQSKKGRWGRNKNPNGHNHVLNGTNGRNGRKNDQKVKKPRNDTNNGKNSTKQNSSHQRRLRQLRHSVQRHLQYHQDITNSNEESTNNLDNEKEKMSKSFQNLQNLRKNIKKSLKFDPLLTHLHPINHRSMPHKHQQIINPNAPLPSPFSPVYCYTLRVVCCCIIAYMRLYNSKSSTTLRSFSFLLYLYKHYNDNLSRFCNLQYDINGRLFDGISNGIGQYSSLSPQVSSQNNTLNIVSLWLSHSFLHINKHLTPLPPLQQPQSQSQSQPNSFIYVSPDQQSLFKTPSQNNTHPTSPTSHLNHSLSPEHILNVYQLSMLYSVQNIYSFWSKEAVYLLPQESFTTPLDLNHLSHHPSRSIIQVSSNNSDNDDDDDDDIGENERGKGVEDYYLEALCQPQVRVRHYNQRITTLYNAFAMSIAQIDDNNVYNQGNGVDSNSDINFTTQFKQLYPHYQSPFQYTKPLVPLALYDYEMDSAFYSYYLLQRDLFVNEKTTNILEASEQYLLQHKNAQKVGISKHNQSTNDNDNDDDDGYYDDGDIDNNDTGTTTKVKKNGQKKKSITMGEDSDTDINNNRDESHQILIQDHTIAHNFELSDDYSPQYLTFPNYRFIYSDQYYNLQHLDPLYNDEYDYYQSLHSNNGRYRECNGESYHEDHEGGACDLQQEEYLQDDQAYLQHEYNQDDNHHHDHNQEQEQEQDLQKNQTIESNEHFNYPILISPPPPSLIHSQNQSETPFPMEPYMGNVIPRLCLPMNEFTHLYQINPTVCTCSYQCSCCNLSSSQSHITTGNSNIYQKHSPSCPLSMVSIPHTLTTSISHRLITLSLHCLGMRNDLYQSNHYYHLYLDQNTNDINNALSNSSLDQRGPKGGIGVINSGFYNTPATAPIITISPSHPDPRLIDLYIGHVDSNGIDGYCEEIAGTVLEAYMWDYKMITKAVIQSPLGFFEDFFDFYSLHNTNTFTTPPHLQDIIYGDLYNNDQDKGNSINSDSTDDDFLQFSTTSSEDDHDSPEDEDKNNIHGNNVPNKALNNVDVLDNTYNYQQNTKNHQNNQQDLTPHEIETINQAGTRVEKNLLIFELTRLNPRFLQQCYKLCPPSQPTIHEAIVAHQLQRDLIINKEGVGRDNEKDEQNRNNKDYYHDAIPSTPHWIDLMGVAYQSSLDKTIKWSIRNDTNNDTNVTKSIPKRKKRYYDDGYFEDDHLSQLLERNSLNIQVSNDNNDSCDDDMGSFDDGMLEIKLSDLFVWLSYYTSLPYLLSLSHHDPFLYPEKPKEGVEVLKNEDVFQDDAKGDKTSTSNVPKSLIKSSSNKSNTQNHYPAMFNFDHLLTIKRARMYNYALSFTTLITSSLIIRNALYLFSAQQLQKARIDHRFKMEMAQMKIKSVKGSHGSSQYPQNGSNGIKKGNSVIKKGNSASHYGLGAYGINKTPNDSLLTEKQVWYSPIDMCSGQYYSTMVPADKYLGIRASQKDSKRLKMVKKGVTTTNTPLSSPSNTHLPSTEPEKMISAPFYPNTGFIVSVPLPLPPPINAAKLLSTLFPIFLITLCNKSRHCIDSDAGFLMQRDHGDGSGNSLKRCGDHGEMGREDQINLDNDETNHQYIPTVYTQYHSQPLAFLYYLRQIETIKCWYCSFAQSQWYRTSIGDQNGQISSQNNLPNEKLSSQKSSLSSKTSKMSSLSSKTNSLDQNEPISPTTTATTSQYQSLNPELPAINNNLSDQCQHNDDIMHLLALDGKNIFKSQLKSIMTQIGTTLTPQITFLITSLDDLTQQIINELFPVEYINHIEQALVRLDINNDVIDGFYLIEKNLIMLETTLTSLNNDVQLLLNDISSVHNRLIQSIEYLRNCIDDVKESSQQDENVTKNTSKTTPTPPRPAQLARLEQQYNFIIDHYNQLVASRQSLSSALNNTVAAYNDIHDCYIQLDDRIGPFIRNNGIDGTSREHNTNNNNNPFVLNSFGIASVDINAIQSARNSLNGNNGDDNNNNNNKKEQGNGDGTEQKDKLKEFHDAILLEQKQHEEHYKSRFTNNNTNTNRDDLKNTGSNMINNYDEDAQYDIAHSIINELAFSGHQTGHNVTQNHQNGINSTNNAEKDDPNEDGDVSFIPKPGAILSNKERVGRQLEKNQHQHQQRVNRQGGDGE